MKRGTIAKNVVKSIPKDVFYEEIQSNFLTSYAFSKLRCGGQVDLTEEEKEILDNAFRGYFPEYDVDSLGPMALAYALTEREVNRI